MKRVKNLLKPQVLCLLFATIVSAILVATSYANYKKATANHSEKVIGEIIEVEKISENYISFFDTINTKITYKVIYEYEWQGKTYQTEVERGLGLFLNYFEEGTKAICHINAENPNDLVVNASDPIIAPIVFFCCFFISFIIIATYFLFDSEKDRIVPMKDKREVICTCPYCKSEKVGVKDVLNDTAITPYIQNIREAMKNETDVDLRNRAEDYLKYIQHLQKTRKIWAYCMICGRTSEKKEVPIETSDDDIIELATAEWRNREKKLSLDELEAVYLARYIRKKENKTSEDEVENFINWCRNNI
ncbi:MAG: hypothetical protein J6A75_13490 [Lachnospiraceae bacterium]|nr:hypothetical protein [Lachnospiraceae bacterium]